MAKFKVGDRVRIVGKGSAYKGKTGQIMRLLAGDKKPYDVDFGGSYDLVNYGEDELEFANSAVRSTNAAVQEAINSACARNSAEVEVSLQYAARVQQAMRDAVRMVSGVRQSSTNTLYCPDDDAAEEVVEILTDAGVPKNEVWINARKVRNDAGANDPKNTEAVKKMWNDFKKRLDAMRREADTLDKKAVAMKVYGVRWDNVTRKLEDAVGLMEGWN